MLVLYAGSAVSVAIGWYQTAQWCCAVFEVTDFDGSQVTSNRKLASIKQVSITMEWLALCAAEIISCVFIKSCLLQMLNIHLRGQEVPACNAGICMCLVLLALCLKAQLWLLEGVCACIVLFYVCR